MQQMNWYENPTIAAIIGAVVGSVLTAAVSIFIWKKTRRVKRVDCVINDASSLLTFSDTIRSELEVKYQENRQHLYFYSILRFSILATKQLRINQF
jgi:hypothetical protein